eukprot:TRINITY_DN51_c0_g2_i4.p1 TRINITY_DN51_c0_g2~~TRINITY_DN51_c0_g2_i4.p1  ORF type:complete len:223 (-),score=92.31 TRINITY_DN51_c0_g2_i4:72-683(-)
MVYHVEVIVVKCVGLPAADLNGLSDPYVMLISSEGKWRSSTVEKTLNPVYNESITIEVADPTKDCVAVEVWDYDKVSEDDLLGTSAFMVNDLVKGSLMQCELTLSKGCNHASGKVVLRMKAVDFTDTFVSQQPQTQQSPPPPPPQQQQQQQLPQPQQRQQPQQQDEFGSIVFDSDLLAGCDQQPRPQPPQQPQPGTATSPRLF